MLTGSPVVDSVQPSWRSGCGGAEISCRHAAYFGFVSRNSSFDCPTSGLFGEVITRLPIRSPVGVPHRFIGLHYSGKGGGEWYILRSRSALGWFFFFYFGKKFELRLFYN